MTAVTRLIALCLLLAACDSKTPALPTVTDLCMQREIFFQCMQALPKGPERVANSNDWDEVIAECRRTAQYLSERPRRLVKPECGRVIEP